MAFVEVEAKDGDLAIGSAFHVGSGVFVTARHVIEGRKIVGLRTTVGRYVADPKGMTTLKGSDARWRRVEAQDLHVTSGPFCHPDSSVDVACFKTDAVDLPTIPLGSHLDDWISDTDFVLREVTVMGYPPISLTNEATLVAARAEINAVVGLYVHRHPHFIVSAMARGGFSGGVCLIEWDFALGIITSALTSESGPVETGYLAVLTVQPIFECLAHHKLLPAEQEEGWDDFWGLTTQEFEPDDESGWKRVVASISVFDNGRRCYLQIAVADSADALSHARTTVLRTFESVPAKTTLVAAGAERYHPDCAFDKAQQLVRRSAEAVREDFKNFGWYEIKPSLGPPVSVQSPDADRKRPEG